MLKLERQFLHLPRIKNHIYKMQGTVTYLPIVIMAILALGFVVTVMVLTHIIVPMFSPKKKSAVKSEVFECGIESQGNARTPLRLNTFWSLSSSFCSMLR
jgi:NADH:ubiquinone oxidoreductase subunit 3 (subunit A)